MNLDVKFSRDSLVLEERNLVLLDDQMADFTLVRGRSSLQVRIWRHIGGLVIVAGPYIDHAMTARWRCPLKTLNRWHSGQLESNFTRELWQCQYRIFREKSAA